MCAAFVLCSCLLQTPPLCVTQNSCPQCNQGGHTLCILWCGPVQPCGAASYNKTFASCGVVLASPGLLWSWLSLLGTHIHTHKHIHTHTHTYTHIATLQNGLLGFYKLDWLLLLGIQLLLGMQLASG